MGILFISPTLIPFPTEGCLYGLLRASEILSSSGGGLYELASSKTKRSEAVDIWGVGYYLKVGKSINLILEVICLRAFTCAAEPHDVAGR